MSMIPDEIIETVRDSADLISIIGETVELKRTGADYRGPCPFHGGQHRNFAVIPKKGRYYCFVCKESGDIFSWYMKRLGMDYPSAVREVARKMGIPIPETSTRQGPDPREPLYQALSAAHDWFARQLRESPEAEDARRYLQSRGLDMETAEPLELGYAPRGQGFQQAMKALGLDDGTLLEAGLLYRREDGKVQPRFRGRLLFPIHDLRSRVVGFGGRIIGPGEPKYLNSPESTVFHKGGTLYNLHAAKNLIRKEESVILVEGYFDVQRLVLAGQENVVAPLGTALTSEQATLLRRFAPTAILLLDSDSAGLKATFRAGDELLKHEMRVKVATMPPGEDPDTLVQKGGLPALQAILDDAVDLMERKIQILERKGRFSDIEHRRDALDRLLPTIRATKDPIQRELYLGLVAERTGVSKAVLEAEANEAPPEPRHIPEAPRFDREAEPVQPPVKVNPGAKAEQQVLRLMLASEEWRARGAEVVQPDWFEHPLVRQFFQMLAAIRESGPAVPPPDVPPAIGGMWQRLSSVELPLDFTGQANLFAGATRRLEARPQVRRYEALMARLAAATPEELPGLMAEKNQLHKDLQARFPEEVRILGYRNRRRSHRSRSP